MWMGREDVFKDELRKEETFKAPFMSVSIGWFAAEIRQD